MKKLYVALLLISTFTFFNKLKATHVIGGEITYRSITADSLEVTITVYRDCSGVILSNSPITITSDTNSAQHAFPRVSVRDITGLALGCNTKSRCDTTGSGYVYGFEEHVFKGNIKLFNSASCKYIMSWEQCCRSANITTGAANHMFHIETTYDKCLAPANSSPKFLDAPIIITALGKDNSISYTAHDVVDNDFLTYELIEPLNSPTTSASYSGSFSKQRPLSFLGFPNEKLPYPAGFRFDTLTGNMFFRPMVNNQITVLTIKVKEWRKINGVMQIISETIRDVLVIVDLSANAVPKIDNNPNSIFRVCTPNNYCITIPVEDADTGNTINITLKHNLKNVTINQMGALKNKKHVKVCFDVDSAMLSSTGSYYLKFSVTDDNCPLAGRAEKTFIILQDSIARPSLPSYSPVCETSNSFYLAANPSYGVWTGNGVQGGVFFSPRLANPGEHYLKYSFSDTIGGCNSLDSIRVRVVQSPKAGFTINKKIGLPTDTFTFINTSTADTTLVSLWNMGQTGAAGNIKGTPNASHVYNDTGIFIVSLIVSNLNICPADTAIDTVVVSNTASIKTPYANTIRVYPNPAKDKLTIEAENGITAIEILDISGKIIYTEKVQQATNITADISSLANGMYLIKTTLIGDQQLIGKLSVRH